MYKMDIDVTLYPFCNVYGTIKKLQSKMNDEIIYHGQAYLNNEVFFSNSIT